MRILELTSTYPKFHGDSTAPFMEAITVHLAAQGHPVHVVLPEHAEWRRESSEGLVHFHPYRYSPLRSWTPWGFAQSLEGGVKLKRSLYALAPSVFASAFRACNALLARETFDVIHAHWVVPNGTIAAAVSARHRLPLVVTLHGSDISISEQSRWMRALARRAFARAAGVTAPSQDLLDRARRIGATGDLELIPWGADPDAFHPDPVAASRAREQVGAADDSFLVVAIGRFVHWKGFAYLIDAVSKVRTDVPHVRLALVGDGDLREELVARARSLGLADRVSFTGMASRDDVAAYLAGADVVAVPSIHHQGYVDGQPTVALEAMSAGKPVIASRIGGLPQLVGDGENGLLVGERDSSALAEAIVKLARDPELRRQMGDRGRQRILDSFTWEHVARRLVAVYERATATSSSRPAA